MYKIVCFGEILWDNLPEGSVPGGAPMNIALHLNEMGHKTALVSKIGNDDAGQKLLEFLKSRNASTEFIQTDAKLETGHVDVMVGGPEDIFFKIAEPVAWDNIQTNDVIIEAVKNAKMFVFGTLVTRNEASKNALFELLDVARTKVYSVNLRAPHYTWHLVEKLLKKADIVKLNESEFKELLHWCGKGYYLEKGGLEYLRNKFELDTILVSRGRKGAVMNRRGEFYKKEGYEIKIVDKVGCGNAFLSAYLHARAVKKEPLERLTYAIAAGAMAATFPGASTNLTGDMLNEFIEQNDAVKI